LRRTPWATRAGEIELAIPKLRRGSYFPSFLEPRRRSEQALVSVVQEAYVAGVSTRKVDQVVESLGLRISKSEVPSGQSPRTGPRKASPAKAAVARKILIASWHPLARNEPFKRSASSATDDVPASSSIRLAD
jgi:hypothetical protein